MIDGRFSRVACVGAVALVALAGCGGADETEAPATGPETEASAPEETTAVPEPEESPEESAGESEVPSAEPSAEESTDEDLAQKLEQAALDQFMVDDFPSLIGREGYDMSLPPYHAITDIESVNSMTARVHVQEDLTEDEEEQMARWFFNMTCSEVPELDTLVIRDVGGVDSNFYAGRFPRMPGCE